MFGLLDSLLVSLSRKDNGSVKKATELVSTNLSQNGKTLVCFLPEIMLRESILGNKFLDSARNVLAYMLSPRRVVRPNPSHTRELLENVYEDALLKVSSHDINPEDLIVLGISLGNCPAYRFAAQTHAKKLISVVPGSRLSESIWESNVTREQVKEAKRLGFKLEDFKEQLISFNPIEYVSEISGHVEVYLGKYDRMIPYYLGRELALSLEEQSRSRTDLTVTTQTHNFGDHASTAYFFARQFLKRRF